MEKFEHVVIGFGKAGKTLAGALAGAGKKVALIERSALRYGGTCINVACIPTKSLEHSARLSAAQGGDFAARAARYQAAVAEKNRLTSMLRQKNYAKAAQAGVTIIDGSARFIDDHRLAVTLADDSVQEVYGDYLYINTGAEAILPPIEGLAGNPYVYTSDTLMERETLPQRLVIVGGGYIGLEFSSYFANFGSSVTVLQDGEAFIPREDAQVAASVLESLTSRGIRVLRSVRVEAVRTEGDHAVVQVRRGEETELLAADAVLVATGRRPLTAGLDLEKAGVAVTPRGAVQVDKTLHTSVPHIFAMGDVAGGLQFTYISLDDYRIVRDQVLGKGARTTENRGPVPYSVFLDPPLSRVGLTEAEAREKGYAVQVALLPAAAVPKAQVLQRPAGLLKAVVDADTGLILGAHLFCAESQEIINVIRLAMDANIPYTVLRDSIYNHPTMTEALNDLFAALK